MTAALVVLLGLSVPLRLPDLQVEAAATAGVELPELANAVARALVASGARVVLRGPSSAPCRYCAKVAVIELGQGNCRVEVKQERHNASAALQFPADSPLFDRARAIAIQARLLVTWGTNPDARTWETRPSARKTERKIPIEHSAPEPQLASIAPALTPSKQAELVDGPPPKPDPDPAKTPNPLLAPQRRVENALVEPVTYVDRVDTRPASRAEAKKPEPAQARSEHTLSAKVSSASFGPRKKQWPWIPTVLGSGAAVAAGICAVVARDRYNALSDKSQPYQTAQALKTEGQNWQLVSIVLSGVAVASLTTGLIGFVTRSTEPSSFAFVAAPMSGGGLVAVAGDLP